MYAGSLSHARNAHPRPIRTIPTSELNPTMHKKMPTKLRKKTYTMTAKRQPPQMYKMPRTKPSRAPLGTKYFMSSKLHIHNTRTPQ